MIDNCPLVSIIMGAYNCENLVSRCIDSIISQTYTNWEFIICNDASIDKTRQIIERYSQVDSRIKLLNNTKNSGLAASLNKCLLQAKGKYVARQDADDESLSDRIETQVLFLEEHPDYDVVGSAVTIFDEKQEYAVRKWVEYPQIENSLAVAIVPHAHPTIMMKKEVYDILGGYTVSPSTMRAEDLDLWIRFYGNGYKGYNCQRSLYKYREGRDDFKRRTLKSALQISKIYKEGFRRFNISGLKRIYLFRPVAAALLPDKLMFIYHKNQKRVGRQR